MENNIRNVCIIAHVDHGKTTLVDHLLKQSGTFQSHVQVDDRYMDSMDLEKERGITIAAKNASFVYKGVKVNIVDTPGHSDFGGEVERILDMVDGAILLVDASEGPLPQTRFVLQKALQNNIKILVCINKVDRPDARTEEVLNEIFDLFVDLDASDEQANFEVVYAVAKNGQAGPAPDELADSLELIFENIKNEFPAPVGDPAQPLQLLVSNIDYDDYVGKLGIGRLRNGTLRVGDEVLVHYETGPKKIKVSALFGYQASKRVSVNEVYAGDIVIVAGFDDINIGDCLTSVATPNPLPRIQVDEPTVAVFVSVNDGPFAGLEGSQVTSRKIRERLNRELLYNVSLRVEDTDSPETWKVIGRGELQLSVLFEQMRREGFEFLVSRPQVIFKNQDGKVLEPMENLVVDVQEDYFGQVTQKLGERKGILSSVDNKGRGRVRGNFLIPARGIIGYRSEFLTDTRGTGLMSTYSAGYEEFKGELKGRLTGAIVSDRKGVATSYALWQLEDRGRHFIKPGMGVYMGMIIGEANKGIELNVNVCKEKKLTNVRASGNDESIKLTPVKPLTLEQALEWINDSELIEVTPENIRLRCRELDPNKRKIKK